MILHHGIADGLVPVSETGVLCKRLFNVITQAQQALFDDVMQDVLLAFKVGIDGSATVGRPCGNVVDAGALISLFGKEGFRRLQNGRPVQKGDRFFLVFPSHGISPFYLVYYKYTTFA